LVLAEREKKKKRKSDRWRNRLDRVNCFVVLGREGKEEGGERRRRKRTNREVADSNKASRKR